MTSIKLGGKERNIKFPYNELCELEIKLGYGIGELFQPHKLGLNAIRMLLWAGLRHEDRSLTLEETGDFIQEYILNEGEMGNIEDIISKELELSGILGNTKKK